MAIPDYQTLMLPLLELARDGEEHSFSDAVEHLADRFRLTEEERAALLPSGRQATIANRVGWTKTYLVKAGLLDTPRRGVFRITDRGLSLLAQHPVRVDNRHLERFPEFQAFKASASPRTRPLPIAEMSATTQTPEELIEESHQHLTTRLADELLERLRGVSPARFEGIVLDLVLAMGYGGSRPDAGRALGRSGDGGVDGLVNEDPLGLDVVYLQAKRWEGVVGRPTVQAFVGSLEGNRARKGVLITTSTFSADASQYVGMIDKKVVLIDGQRLTQLMVEHDVGVTTGRSYAVKRLDVDYFDEGAS